MSTDIDTAHVNADTLYTCVTHTYFDNDIFTSTNLSGLEIYQAVGALTDSFFGTMTGATFFQITPPSPGFTFDTSYTIDSVVLFLPYSGFTYGDTVDQSLKQSFQVFYLGDTLGYSSPYYPYTDKAIDYASPLSDPVEVNIYRLKDSISINGTNQTPGLRIKLKHSAALSKINAALSTAYNSSDDKTLAFISAFKGLCVKPSDPRVFTKAIPYFRLDPLGSSAYTQACIQVFHHGSAADTTPRLFAFAQNDCAHYNSITKSYSRYPLNKLVNSTLANDSIIALQNKPGASIDIKIGGLLSKIPKGVVINKADIQISVLSNSAYHHFELPDQLYPVGIGNGTYPSSVSAGIEYTIADRYPTSSTSPYYILDGNSHTLTYGTTDITTYSIGVPREVIASIAAGNDTLHFHIHGTQVRYGAYRMLAGGGNNTDTRYKAKLIVVHSSLKN